MAYKVIILYRLYMPSYFLGTFTEYPYINSIMMIGLNSLVDSLYRSIHLKCPAQGVANDISAVGVCHQ